MATTVALARPPPPSLQEATKNSTEAWQEHLQELFNAAKDRFPDVVWELVTEHGPTHEVWGHKAIVYARAPPSFQTRYFSFRPHTPLPNTESAVSLDAPRTPSPYRSSSPTDIAPAGGPLRLTTSISPALFSNELEYLYTGKGFGEAFEFLFDSPETRLSDDDAEELRIDKLRKDLVFMWRSRLYSDVRISLTGNFSTSHENTTAIFSSHRFVLVSRSSYFHTALIGWPTQRQPGAEPPTLTLPSPPFTPASVHFTLGFLYTGTLVFSHRTYDLSTAFAILRAALYLSIPTLHDEVQARIIQEMLHGLFHAFITFAEYDSLTGGKWGTGGCRCRQCARRAPRVLEFALADDVKNPHLERGGRRALVGLFGEGWCTQEFASLSPKIHESVLKGVGKRTTAPNVLPLLFAAEHAFAKLGSVIDPWADTIRELILNARKTIDETLCKEADAVFATEDWVEIMESDGVRFEDGERVEWTMASLLRGVKESNAPSVYQTLVSSILLRPHPTDSTATLLSPTSHVRVQVEQARVELLKWIGKRWFTIRQERAFDALEGWALKEISDHIEVNLEDLLNPPPPSYSSGKTGSPGHAKRNASSHLRPISNHPHTSRVDAESASSMRPSVLTRSFKQSIHSSTDVSSSRSSVHSLARSVASSTNTARLRNSGISPAKRIVNQTRAASTSKDRPDSKFTDTDSGIYDDADEGHDASHDAEGDERAPSDEEEDGDDGDDADTNTLASSILPSSISGHHHPPSPSPSARSAAVTPPKKKTLITKASVASAMSRVGSPASTSKDTTPTRRPKSPSSASVHSKASTIRKSSATFASAKTSPGTSRPVSRGSMRSVTAPKLTVNPAASPKTPNNPNAPSRSTSRASRISTSTRPTSTASTNTTTTESAMTFRTASGGTTSSGGGGGLTTPVSRSRRTSTASSVASVRTTGASSPVAERQRKISSASVSSVASVRSATAARNRVASAAAAAAKKAPPVPVPDPKKLAVPIKPARSVSSSSSRSSSSRGKAPAPAVAVTPPEMPKEEVKPIELEEAKADEEEQEKEKEKDKEVVVPSPPPPPPPRDDLEVGNETITNTSSTLTIKAKPLPPLEHKKTDSAASTVSTASSSSVTTLKRKGSNDTIRTVKSSNLQPPPPTDGPTNKRASASSASSSAASSTISKPSSSNLREAISIPSLPSLDQTPPPKPNPTPLPPNPLLPSLDHTLAKYSVPRGATLDIGIPCIISSKRKRFKAYARYIGEVEGETGPWVGVEVPMPIGDSQAWGDASALGSQILSNDDRAWHDGTWGGIRYFEISGGGGGSEWEYGGEDRASRRRRTDPGTGGGGGMGGGMGNSSMIGMSKFGITFSGIKREGDTISISSERMKRMRSASPAVSDMSSTESRGLFVRPQQVLYVVDAVGSDL